MFPDTGGGEFLFPPQNPCPRPNRVSFMFERRGSLSANSENGWNFFFSSLIYQDLQTVFFLSLFAIFAVPPPFFFPFTCLAACTQKAPNTPCEPALRRSPHATGVGVPQEGHRAHAGAAAPPRGRGCCRHMADPPFPPHRAPHSNTTGSFCRHGWAGRSVDLRPWLRSLGRGGRTIPDRWHSDVTGRRPHVSLTLTHLLLFISICPVALNAGSSLRLCCKSSG